LTDIPQLEELKARLTAATELRLSLLLPLIELVENQSLRDRIINFAMAEAWESAVIALTEAVLPEWNRRIIACPGLNFDCRLWKNETVASSRYGPTIKHVKSDATHKSEPIALLLATVSALIEREKNDG